MPNPQFVSVPVTLDFKVEPWSIDKFDSPEFVDEWRKCPHALTTCRITSDGDIAPLSERGDSTTLFVHIVFTARNYEVTKGKRAKFSAVAAFDAGEHISNPGFIDALRKKLDKYWLDSNCQDVQYVEIVNNKPVATFNFKVRYRVN